MACVCVTNSVGGDQGAVDSVFHAAEGHSSGVHDQRQGGQLGQRTGFGVGCSGMWTVLKVRTRLG